MSVLVTLRTIRFLIFFSYSEIGRDPLTPISAGLRLTSQRPCLFYNTKALPFFGNYTHIFHENSAKETS